MENEVKLVKTVEIPKEYRKRTTLAKVNYYDKIEIYENRVVGYLEGQQIMTWFFKEYTGVDIVKANINSQFGQVIFLTGINSKNRAIGLDFFAAQNLNAVQDSNRMLFCAGMYSFGKTNEFTLEIGEDIRECFEKYKNNEILKTENVNNEVSAADEIRKYKQLLDDGIITQEEFDTKKKQLLGL